MTDGVEPESQESSGRGSRFWILTGVIVVAIIVAGVLIYQASLAAFTTQTSGGGSFSSGEIALSHDKPVDAEFAFANLQPGDTHQDDIVVTYSGTLDSEVRLYAESSGTSQDLASQIQLTIAADGATGSPWTGTLAEFQAITDFAQGILPIEVTSAGASQTYTVSYEVLADAPMGSSADVTFVWEAQSK